MSGNNIGSDALFLFLKVKSVTKRRERYSGFSCITLNSCVATKHGNLTLMMTLALQIAHWDGCLFLCAFVCLLSKYASVNISTNLYVISQPWLFSLAWCAGAHSVTTNAPHLLKILHKPIFLMVRDGSLIRAHAADLESRFSYTVKNVCFLIQTPHEYNLMWILTDIVSAIFITAVFIFHWWARIMHLHHTQGWGAFFSTGFLFLWKVARTRIAVLVRQQASAWERAVQQV